ncbi:MAG: hypothetical protein PHR30_02395 [Gallionellaceae bacterium]|nr:hypothetical protein [Gallionellaceae bacterium]
MINRFSAVRLAVFVVGLAVLAGCAGDPIKRKNGQHTSRPFVINNLAKSDIDMVTEQTQRQVLAGLRRLTVKLYRRNPQEYRKAGYGDVEAATGQIFNQLPRWRQSGLDRVDWAESLRLAFSESYAGDRVHAYMLALIVMTMASYDHRVEFYMTDDLSAQSLYNSARNLETAAWKLANARTGGGAPFLLSNGVDEEVQNLSFEREFGKLIAQQDLLALVIEDKSNRSINRVFQNVASFVLLPV